METFGQTGILFDQHAKFRTAQQEMARTLEDVLARRTRALFLNASAAIEASPAVADLLAQELGWDEAMKHDQVAKFKAVAGNYLPS